MRTIIVLLFAILLAACSSGGNEKSMENEKKETKQVEEVASTEVEMDLSDLLKGMTLDEQMEQACGDLTIEYEKVKLRVEDKKPSVVAFCHSNGDATLDGNISYTKVAMPAASADEWEITGISDSEIGHPAKFLGVFKDEDGKETAIIEYNEIAASSGRKFSAVYFNESTNLPEMKVENSEYTLYGTVSLKGRIVTVEDELVTETFSYEQGEFEHRSSLKEVDNSADLIIYYDKDSMGKLIFSEPNNSVLNVKAGDRISFRRTKPITLEDFQIRTDLGWDKNNPETLIVTEENLGQIVEVGESPYNEMTTFVVGKASNEMGQIDFLRSGYLQQLKKGFMPGSKIQLSDSNNTIETILGPPITSYGESGANHLYYEDFAYAIPFLEEEGDRIYGIVRIVKPSERVTGIDLESAWGKPSSAGHNQDEEPSLLIWSYDLNDSYRVSVEFDGVDKTSNIVSITLFGL